MKKIWSIDTSDAAPVWYIQDFSTRHFTECCADCFETTIQPAESFSVLKYRLKTYILQEGISFSMHLNIVIQLIPDMPEMEKQQVRPKCKLI